jgi:hypothetical protein
MPSETIHTLQAEHNERLSRGLVLLYCPPPEIEFFGEQILAKVWNLRKGSKRNFMRC